MQRDRRLKTRKLANALGWFSIGLGLAEVIGDERLAPKIGLAQRVGLAAGNKEPGLWFRVAGDALDLGVLAEGVFAKKSSSRTGAAQCSTEYTAASASESDTR